MKVLHDLICRECNTVFEDVLADHVTEKFECDECGHKPLEILFRECPSMKIFENERFTTDGKFQRATVADDPLIQQELGLVNDCKFATLSPEERAGYRERYFKEGDSPALRDEVSELSAKNRKANKERKTSKKRPKAYMM